MRLRNITGCREMIGESEFVVHEPETMKGKWREAFGNDHPVYVEIGMGKGRFLMDMARLYPEINFIGIEKYSSVLLRAVQKLEEEELPNVRLIRMDAALIGGLKIQIGDRVVDSSIQNRLKRMKDSLMRVSLS